MKQKPYRYRAVVPKSADEVLMEATVRNASEGERAFPPQNMLLWHGDYFKLLTFKKQQTQVKL